MYSIKKNLSKKLLLFASLFSLAILNAQDCNDDIHTGEGTFYGGVAGSSGGNCGLPVPADDILHCALNTIDYDGSQACGACLEVEGTQGKSIVLKVVDRCPECKEGDVDLHQDAFALIDNPISGRIPISWKFVPCPLKSSNEFIQINFKSGSTKYWTAIQLRNSTQGIKSLDYKNAAGGWTAIERTLFNFFIETKGIESPMVLRATSVLGEELLFENINIDVANDFNTSQQFENSCDSSTLTIKEHNANTKDSPKVIVSKNEIKISGSSQEWKIYDTSGKMIDYGTDNMIKTQNLAHGVYFFVTEGKSIKFYR